MQNAEEEEGLQRMKGNYVNGVVDKSYNRSVNPTSLYMKNLRSSLPLTELGLMAGKQYR